jgi:hypothetical protein
MILSEKLKMQVCTEPYTLYDFERQLQYSQLAVDVFPDMMFMKVKSRCQNTCAQVFMMANGFTWAYLMASKSQVHEALCSFHQREGVPNVMVMERWF